MAVLCSIPQQAKSQNPEKKPSEDKKETFYSQAQRAIVRLEHENTSGTSIGTAFFVHTKNDWYVVTTAHEAAQAFPWAAKIPLALNEGGSVLTEMVFPEDKWVFHPDAGDATHFRVDVAAMKIKYLGGSLKSFNYCKAECAAGEYDQLANDPEPPAPDLVFGFPVAPGVRVSRPFGRHGIVAFLEPEEYTLSIENRFFDKRGFAFDIPNIVGGNSGSPVISLPPLGKLTLAGLVSGTNIGGGLRPCGARL